ncbi:MAG: peptidase M28, partial [Flavobacteriaceae bacterium]|nr:peptidase M28 [Flavobacteriaceae bacterium]
AAYFIIPVFFGLLSLWVLIRQEKPNVFLMLLFVVPALFLLAPLIQFFPIGLGLKMLIGSALFTVLLFGLLIPVIGFYSRKKGLAYLSFLFAIVFFFKAHATSDFNEDRKKPNSLVYYKNVDANQAYWLTYDSILDSWTKGYLGEQPLAASDYVESAAGSKYNTGYSYAAEAPTKDLNSFKLNLIKDTITDNIRHVNFVLSPQRKINLLRFYTDKTIVFSSFECNGEELRFDKVRNNKVLFKYYVSDQDSLDISYTVPDTTAVEFNVLEYSYDLLSHKDFTINKRPEDMMPKPFISTDAIVLKKKIVIDSLK